MSFGTYERIVRLLGPVDAAPSQPSPIGATADQLAIVERKLGCALPTELRRWLGLCNGYIAGEGFLYGAHPRNQDLDIAYLLDLRPEWGSRRWVPVANDGFGNAYVMVCADGNHSPEAVYFVDAFAPAEIACVVASSLPRFLNFYLETRFGEREQLWPIDREYVLARDPELARVDARLLPWNQN